MNTGGGATKVMNLGPGGIVFHKNMPEPPPIFRLIQTESGEVWENMFRTFNCGVGLDVIGDEGLGGYLAEVEAETGVRLYDLGYCSVHPDPLMKSVELSTPYSQFVYDHD